MLDTRIGDSWATIDSLVIRHQLLLVVCRIREGGMACGGNLLSLEDRLCIGALSRGLPLLLLVLDERSSFISAKEVAMMILSPGISSRHMSDLSLGSCERKIITIVFAIKVPSIVNH